VMVKEKFELTVPYAYLVTNRIQCFYI
jgi:hypothetical protein